MYRGPSGRYPEIAHDPETLERLRQEYSIVRNKHRAHHHCGRTLGDCVWLPLARRWDTPIKYLKLLIQGEW